MSLHSWGDQLISRVPVAGAAPPEQGELSLEANSSAGLGASRVCRIRLSAALSKQYCETEHMQLGMLVRENSFIPNTSKNPSGF